MNKKNVLVKRNAGFTIYELIITIGGLGTIVLVVALVVALIRFLIAHS